MITICDRLVSILIEGYIQSICLCIFASLGCFLIHAFWLFGAIRTVVAVDALVWNFEDGCWKPSEGYFL